MATVQMIFRRGQKSIETDSDYLGAAAHSSVFAAGKIDLMKMIKLANGLRIADIPPMVSLAVVEESGPKSGVDQSLAGLPEQLFDTPGAVARVVRLSAYEKRMVIRARATGAGTDKVLRYRWAVLRGDRIRINQREPSGGEVELVVPWQERFTRHGARIVDTDALGRAIKAEIMDYGIKRIADQRMVVTERASGRYLYYRYSGADDRYGELRDP